ncbi:MAG: peptide deformylase [Patescibacteria group bacterium]
MKEELRKLAKFPEEIRWLGDPILRAKTKQITNNEISCGQTTKDIQKLKQTLNKIRRLGRGVALAAPQIGISKSLTVVFWEGLYLPFINPVIIKHSKNNNTFPEGCLSSLPLIAAVIRPAEIEVRYLDENGNHQQKSFDGKLARILQHEIDHLNGVLFIERADLKTIQFVADFDEYKNTAELVDV